MKELLIYKILDEENIQKGNKGRLFIGWVMEKYNVRTLTLASMMKEVYTRIAEEFNETPNKVERAIRYAKGEQRNLVNKDFLIYMCQRLEEEAMKNKGGCSDA